MLFSDRVLCLKTITIGKFYFQIPFRYYLLFLNLRYCLLGGYVKGETGRAQAMDYPEDHRDLEHGRRRGHRFCQQPT